MYEQPIALAINPDQHLEFFPMFANAASCPQYGLGALSNAHHQKHFAPTQNELHAYDGLFDFYVHATLFSLLILASFTSL